MPVTSKSFYSKKTNEEDDEDNESESRWGHSKFVSDITVPPSTQSSAMSAPSEGYSAPLGSATTSPAKSNSSNPQILNKTRFARSLSKTKAVGGVTISPAWQPFKPPQRQLVNGLLEIPATSKCAQWIIGCDSERKSTADARKEGHKGPIVPPLSIVDYSPSSSSTSSYASNFKGKSNSTIASPAPLTKRKIQLMSQYTPPKHAKTRMNNDSRNSSQGILSPSKTSHNIPSVNSGKQSEEPPQMGLNHTNATKLYSRSNIPNDNIDKENVSMSSSAASQQPNSSGSVINESLSSEQSKMANSKQTTTGTKHTALKRNSSTLPCDYLPQTDSNNTSKSALPSLAPTGTISEKKKTPSGVRRNLASGFQTVTKKLPEMPSHINAVTSENDPSNVRQILTPPLKTVTVSNQEKAPPIQNDQAAANLTPYARLRYQNLKENAILFKQQHGVNIPVNDTTVTNANDKTFSSSSESESNSSDAAYEIGSSDERSSDNCSSGESVRGNKKTKKKSTGTKQLPQQRKSSDLSLNSLPQTASNGNSSKSAQSKQLKRGSLHSNLQTADKAKVTTQQKQEQNLSFGSKQLASQQKGSDLSLRGLPQTASNSKPTQLKRKSLSSNLTETGSNSKRKKEISAGAKRCLFNTSKSNEITNLSKTPSQDINAGTSGNDTSSADFTQSTIITRQELSDNDGSYEHQERASSIPESKSAAGSDDKVLSSFDLDRSDPLTYGDFFEDHHSTLSVDESNQHQERASPTPESMSSAGSDDELSRSFEGDLAEPLSDGDLNDHHQAALLKPQTKVAMKRERKRLRNCGEPYSRKGGMVVPARSPRPIHDCRKQCSEIVSEENATKLCTEFWKTGDFNRQRQYIASKITYKTPSRRRSKLDSQIERVAQFHYHVDIDGVRHQVCKATFLNIFCLSEKMVRSVTDSMVKSGLSLPSNSLRGHHAPKHKLKEETEAAIKRHIDSFPSYVSHYARAQTNSLYFASNLTLKIMYELYQETENPSVSFSVYYSRVKQSGRKFKKATFSTCNKCDQLRLEIDAATDEDKKKSLLAQRERHHRKAEQAYNTKRKMKEEAKTDPSMRVLVYDMEKCLPCPFLKNKDAFYMRQLNIFNITVTDTTTKLTHCYMWHEVEGGRTANAIASCLSMHIANEIPSSVTRIVIFSDACTSQNRNSHVSAMYLVALQEHPSLQSIEHIFLIPGHTHLEVDNKHSVIERFKDNQDKITHPDEWYSLVKETGMSDPKFPDGKFIVVRMHQKFFDFSHLLEGPLIKRKTTVNGNKFNWLDTNWFKYTKDRIGLVEVRSSYNQDAYFDQLSFVRRGVKPSTLQPLRPFLNKCFTRRQAISEEKKEDLLSLLPYIEEKYHKFYRDLPTSSTVQDVDPDLEDAEDELL